ncbi:hypothetical protein [Pelagibius sp. Alg239-R121]|uniref:hypothetical protein n=1 Tax=Pelagibius sp. Alg239-R121 TaxID=2993448 RepID=UPI0024A6F8E3|nr:hypothetical protein [Pelagibius sp. Alg239-R121]
MSKSFLPSMVVLILSLTWTWSAEAEISVTHPRHYATPPKRVTTKPAAVPHGKVRLPPIKPGVLLRSDDTLGTGNWNLDQVLSEYCREGKFVQKRDRRYTAVLNGRTYGAATSSRATLYDPRGVAAPDTVYVFRSQGTSRCRVYHRGQLQPPAG